MFGVDSLVEAENIVTGVSASSLGSQMWAGQYRRWARWAVVAGSCILIAGCSGAPQASGTTRHVTSLRVLARFSSNTEVAAITSTTSGIVLAAVNHLGAQGTAYGTVDVLAPPHDTAKTFVGSGQGGCPSSGDLSTAAHLPTLNGLATGPQGSSVFFSVVNQGMGAAADCSSIYQVSSHPPGHLRLVASLPSTSDTMFGPLAVDRRGDLYAVVSNGGSVYTIREWPRGGTVARNVAGNGLSYTNSPLSTSGNALATALPPIGELTFAPDGSLCGTEPGFDQAICINLRTNQLHTLAAQISTPTGMAFSPDGGVLLASGVKGTIEEFGAAPEAVGIMAGGGTMNLQAGPMPSHIQATRPRLALGPPNYDCLATTPSGLYVLDNDVGSVLLYLPFRGAND